MEIYKNYEYHSVFSYHIRKLIEEKRSLGFLYNDQAYQLFRFDQFWCKNNPLETVITQDNISGWLDSFQNESKSSHSARVGAVKCLSQYLISIGIPSYVPIETIGVDHPVVHVLNKNEILEFFQVTDKYMPHPYINNPAYNRLAKEYPIIFRLIYCCGLRPGEACSLEMKNVDTNAGIITILNGKRQKDRLVYLSQDLCRLLTRYIKFLQQQLIHLPEWLFPSLNPGNHIGCSYLGVKFKLYWNQTNAAQNCDQVPTPHCLRHTFVVNRINSWTLAGMDLDVMLPYLSRYLGHKSYKETFYYYHMVDDALKIVRQMDSTGKEVIPEVKKI